MTLLDHVCGALYGQALGDAWGMPALLTPRQTWQRFGGWIDRLVPAPDDHPVHAGLPAGRATDDTGQAFALAEAILEDGAVTVEGAARAILRWYEASGGETCPYVGPSTRRAVERLRKGIPPTEAGKFGDTNGAAMRASVVGLVFPGHPREAAHAGAIQSIPTHHTGVAMSGAASVAAAVAHALVPGATLDGIIAAAIEGAQIGLAAGPIWMGASVARRIDIAVEIAQRPVPAFDRILELAEVIGSTLATTEAVPAAFGILVMGQGDPRQTAMYAAALGGDADTVGAIACAISGAWRGLGAMPRECLETLRTANPELDFERIAHAFVTRFGSTAAASP